MTADKIGESRCLVEAGKRGCDKIFEENIWDSILFCFLFCEFCCFHSLCACKQQPNNISLGYYYLFSQEGNEILYCYEISKWFPILVESKLVRYDNGQSFHFSLWMQNNRVFFLKKIVCTWYFCSLIYVFNLRVFHSLILLVVKQYSWIR